jgi:signal transduction histidine kinase
MTLNSLAFRLVAGAAVWSGIALLVGGLVLASTFRSVVTRNFDSRLIVIWESLVVVAEQGDDKFISVDTPLSDPRFGQTFSGWYWQIEPTDAPFGELGPNIRSRSLWDQVLVTPAGVNASDYMRGFLLGPENQDLRFVARNVFLPGSEQAFTIVVAADRSGLANNILRFNTILTQAFVLLALGLLIAMLIQVRLGLSPLRRVRRALVAIRTGRAERLDGSFPAEIVPLANELNALITHNTEVLERSRTQVGNLAHALKTPLSVLTNEVQADQGPLAIAVRQQMRLMKDQVDHYLARARAAATSQVIGTRTDVGQVLSDLTRTIGKIYPECAVDLSELHSGILYFRGERQDLEEMIGNLLDNACKWAKLKVKVSAASVPAPMSDQQDSTPVIKIVIEDDGPGLTEAQQKSVIKRGTRMDEATPGSGLGLSIVMEFVELYGGTVLLERSELGGLSVTLLLPSVGAD